MARSSQQPPHPESVALLREHRGTDPGTERGTMGSFFRSEEMALCQLFIQPEAAYPSVAELGEAGSVQFRDLNVDVNAFQRKFVNEVRRCDELERKLRYIEGELHKDSVPIPELKNVPRAPNPREIADLEASLEKTESEILELSQNAVNLKSNFLELLELKHVLEKTESFFSEREGNGGDSVARGLIEDPSLTSHAHARLGFVAGVVPRERVPAFERMLWRISRGNVFLRQTEIDEALEDPSTGNAIYKTVFVAFFQGEQLKTRVKKVCTGFHASLYPCPSEYNERYDMVKGVCTRLEDLNLVLNQTQDHRQRVLVSVAKELQNWMIMVRKMKAIYHTLNMFNMDVTKKCLIAECWVPVSELASVRKALEDGGKACGSSIPSFLNVIETSEAPPTFNRANKFTKGFQNLIDSYGVSSYREVNPALYTIITFPFLFAIMFGDAGHGLILTAFGLYMVIREEQLGKQKSSSEIWNIFFAGRYIILLMGLFSMYTGIIYNDVFSKSLNIFGSSWGFGFTVQDVRGNVALTLDPFDHYAKNNGTPYPLGLDPIWQGAENKIIFLNSYKMKLSIIFGVVHMIFGVTLSVINHLHFRRAAYILLEFVPQLLFLVLLFAYMVAMMFMKWSMYYPQRTKDCRIENCTEEDLEIIRYGTSCAPSVLILFINMMLFKSAETPGLGCNEYMFDGQQQMQQVFVYIALLCIPALLLGKPLYIFCCKRRRKHKHHASGNGDINQGMELTPEMGDIPNDTTGEVVHEEHEEPMGEILIHQAIHTIEYILSTISHTASYLRLWALSLAHAQLSEVLWNMVLAFGLHPPLEGNAGSLIISGIILFVVFGAWAAFTLAILVMMEGLSAFLHTLRLHWVEFMSKFYEGAGYTFQPFSFKIILENEDAAEE